MVIHFRTPPARFEASARARLATVGELGIDGRPALRFLAETGAFVFHGSPDGGRTLLRPRQPMTFSGRHRRMVGHGGPAVCATLDPDIAIFRALTHPTTIGAHVARYQSAFRVGDDGVVAFRATAGTVDYASREETSAWVYVLDRSGFAPFSAVEVRRTSAVRPLAAIMVSGLDLPGPIYGI